MASDSLNEIGKFIRQTRDSADRALKKQRPDRPSVERTRDIFDVEVPFTMQFEVNPNQRRIICDLEFNKPPPMSNNDTGTGIVGYCETFRDMSAGDHELSLYHPVQAGSVRVYVNGATYPTSTWRIITYGTDSGNGVVLVQNLPLYSNIVVICYIVAAEEGVIPYYTPTCEDVCADLITDTFSRTITGGWGTSDAGIPWDISGPAESRSYVNTEAGILDVTSPGAAYSVQASLDFPHTPEEYDGFDATITLSTNHTLAAGNPNNGESQEYIFIGMAGLYIEFGTSPTIGNYVCCSYSQNPYNNIGTHSVNYTEPFKVRIGITGLDLSLWIWSASSTQPTFPTLVTSPTLANYEGYTVFSIGVAQQDLPLAPQNLILTVDNLNILGINACSEYRFDNFNRTVASGWGTSDSGYLWSDVGSSAPIAVSDGFGTLAPTNTFTFAQMRSPVITSITAGDRTLTARLKFSSVTLGGSEFFATRLVQIDDIGVGSLYVTSPYVRLEARGVAGQGRPVGQHLVMYDHDGVVSYIPVSIAINTLYILKFKMNNATGSYGVKFYAASVSESSSWDIETATTPFAAGSPQLNIETTWASTGSGTTSFDYIDFDYDDKPCYQDCSGITDTFSRTVTEGWGTSDSGYTWVVSGEGSYNVNGAAALIYLTGASDNNQTNVTLPVNTASDFSVLIDFTLSGDGLSNIGATDQGAVRVGQGSDYSAWLFEGTATTSTIRLYNSGGYGTSNLSFPLSFNVTYRSRFERSSGWLRLRIWEASTAEPTSWTQELDISSAAVRPNDFIAIYLNSFNDRELTATFDNLDISDVPSCTGVNPPPPDIPDTPNDPYYPPPIVDPPTPPDAYARYISPTGSDTTGDGSIESPWASIQKFIDSNPAPGNTLYLRGGNYNPATQGGETGRDIHGSLIGTASSPITIRNFPNETPVFPNAAAKTLMFSPNETSNTMGANYVIVDGLHFPGGTIYDEAVIVVGGHEDTYRLVKNITFRNLYMSLASDTISIDHCIGIIHNAENITIEDCVFVGPGGAGQGGSGVTVYSQPAALNTIIRRCIFDGFNNDAAAAILIWDFAGTPVLTLTIDHCTFLNNNDEIDLRVHDGASVTNCAFDGATGSVTSSTSPIYDPSATVTLSNNFFNQIFDSNYYLIAGQTGINAASDGTDAGALNYVSVIGYFMSPSGSDTTGNGSIGNPWASLQKFIDSNPEPGTTLWLLDGTYVNAPYSRAGWYELPLVGTATTPITIAAYPGASPVFSGGSGPILGLSECSYVIIDGLSFINRDVGDSGHIFTGAFHQSGYPAHHITIRNTTFNFNLTGKTWREHALYLSEGTEYVTVEDCMFIGPGIGNGGGYGFHAYSSDPNGPRNLISRRNIFKNWDQAGIVIWNPVTTVDIIHNTFISNEFDIRLEYFSDVEVRDCAFDSPSGTTAIFHGTPTSASYNFFSQAFDSNYYLLAGETGRSAASDGTDAGALDW